tara:strand:+ start:22645 stop:29850 length:7206 start_codon:yes stop_codon:yes gene_type:complete
MPLNKLENFIKNYEGRILYVNSNDLDATDSITNQGNSLTKPFKTIQRALIEAARFSYVVGNDNDYNSRTTILVYPGDHTIDNRPGYGIRKTSTSVAEAISPGGAITSNAQDVFGLDLDSNFDITQEDNILYKFNSIHGGIILPRGTSLVGLDLRKTKIRPKYVPNPTDPNIPNSALFRITGQCYFWQFSMFDADDSELVYTDNKVFTSGSGNLATPTFSHHKLTCFEYADGVTVPTGYNETDLDMYYAKLSNAFNEGSGRRIDSQQKFPIAPEAFSKERPEWEIVGAFATDPVNITSIISGDSATPSPIITVNTETDHGLTVGTPIKIRGVNVNDYNVSTVVTSVTGKKTFTYLLPFVRNNLPASPGGAATVTIETDSVKGSSPYIFNCSMRSVWGMNGMRASGEESSGFRSMVVAQFTGISLQKDDRAFVKYDPVTRSYSGLPITKVTGAQLASQSSSTDSARVYHLDQDAVYRKGWETAHIKIVKDSILQIVSVFAIGFNKHFTAESGGDASITNSNSNFGQFALHAEGFKKEAFSKDNHGYITSIISPKIVPSWKQSSIDWISIDVAKTINTGISSHLYLYGFNTKDNVPPNLIQGYRVGARSGDLLYLDLPNGVGTKNVQIQMSDNTLGAGVTATVGTISANKEYIVSTTTSAPNYDTLVLEGNHDLQTGETIILVSDNGDLPENIIENKKYYTITTSVGNEIKVASSLTNAKNGTALALYGGDTLRIKSRVSDRDSGDIGSPIQYDSVQGGWFVHTSAANDIYNSIVTLGPSGFTEPRTDVTYFKRIADNRSIDEKIYKVRFVIPKEAVNAKDPSEGFILQESSTTGALSNSEFSLASITQSDYSYKRNNKFISTCTYDSANKVVTVTAAEPHNLNVGERVFIKNVKSSVNPSGAGVTGFNGDFSVTSISDRNTFTYSTTDIDGLVHNVGIFSGTNSDVRDISLPRFERNDLKSNLYLYRRETITPYEFNVQDGIYHLYILNADNAVANEFTDYRYGQKIENIYPQLDRDNFDDNPPSAKSFAKRSPLGDVVTNDLKNSISRESLDIAVKKFGIGPVVSSYSAPSGGIGTITTTLEHGLGGIVGYSTITGNAQAYTPGTYYNVKLLNNDNSWNGATAKVVVSGAGNSVTSLEVQAGGSGYQTGATLKLDGFNNATIGINSSVISSSKNNSLQVTGIGTASDGLFRIVDVLSKNTLSIAATTGDPTIYPGQYIFNVAPSASASSQVYNSVVGITTVTCTSAHGLVIGNRVRALDSSDNNIGDYVVSDVVGINTLAVMTTMGLATGISGNAARILKHGFNANDLTSDVDGENLGSRGIPFYDNEFAYLQEDILTDVTTGIATFAVQSRTGAGSVGVGTTARFELGSFIQVGNEILRVSSSSLTGAGTNQIQAIRGYLGTQKENHFTGALIKKIKPIPVEFRRPSILRASGQTFEYLGYGPGNYSTGLPQIQNKTLTDRENFLAQAQERDAGQIVYTGMNSDGDFFIGNTKYSASSGTQQTFDIPVPTVTGQDPSRLSVVFDEVIVKERILVEGGKSDQILSQFDGPVTYNGELIVNNNIKLNGPITITELTNITNDTDSTSCTTGSLVTKGGIGVQKSVYICGDVSVGGTGHFHGGVQFNTGLFPDHSEDAYLGTHRKEWSGAWIGGIGIATEGVPGGTEVADRTIEGLTGNLVLQSKTGVTSVTDRLEVGVGASIGASGLFSVGIITAYGSEPGIQTSGVHLLDDAALYFGDNRDLQVTHDGSNSYVKFNDAAGVGGLYMISDEFRIRNQDNDEDYIRTTRDKEVSLFFDGTSKFETIGYGVTTHGHLTVGLATATPSRHPRLLPGENLGAAIGISTLRFSEAHIGNLRLATGDDNEIDTASGGLTLDSTSGTTTIDDNLIVTGSAQFGTVGTGHTFGFYGDDITINADVTLPNHGGIFKKVRIAVAADNEIDTSSGNLVLDSADGTVNVTDNLDVDGNLNVDGNSQFDGTVNVDTSLEVDNIFVDGNTITTNNSNGNLILSANGTGKVKVNDSLQVVFNSQFDANLNVDGDTTLDTTDIAGTLTVVGDAQLDNININGNTIASTDTNGVITLDPAGTGDVNVEGPLDVNDSATFSSTVVIEGQTTINDSLRINAANEHFRIRNGSDTTNQFLVDSDNGNTTINGTLRAKGNTVLEGNLTVHGDTTHKGNTTLGDATSDTVTFTAKIADGTDILAAGNSCDIGSDGTPFDNGYFTNIKAGSITGPVSGASSKIKTWDRSQTNPSGHYLTFVSSSGDQSEMDVYTNADFYVLPDSTTSESDLCVRGDITAFAGAASDDRLKTNKVILEGALDKVLSLSGFTFNWNGLAVDLGFVAEKQQVGVSAQQVQAVLPEAVKTRTLDDEEILIVKYEKIVPLLIEAIKELNTKVDNLEQKLLDK